MYAFAGLVYSNEVTVYTFFKCLQCVSITQHCLLEKERNTKIHSFPDSVLWLISFTHKILVVDIPSFVTDTSILQKYSLCSIYKYKSLPFLLHLLKETNNPHN